MQLRSQRLTAFSAFLLVAAAGLPTIAGQPVEQSPAAETPIAEMPVVVPEEVPAHEVGISPESRVIVTLRSGRRFLGTVDPRTGNPQTGNPRADSPRADDPSSGGEPAPEGRLWMRFELGGAVILRPIAWSRVVSITDEQGRPIGVDRLGELVGRWKEQDPDWERRLAIDSVADDTTKHESTASRRQPLADARRGPVRADASRVVRAAWSASALAAAHSSRGPARARGFHFEAYLANWDGDVEADGLMAIVRPFDADGRSISLSGTLAVELIGRHDSVSEGPTPFPTIGRWTVRIERHQFVRGAVVVKLPLQSVHPQFDTWVATHGVLHARLTAAGHGSFDRTLSHLRIRPFSGNRDRLELLTGERFFPSERTGRNQ